MNLDGFEARKADHLRLSMDPSMQAAGHSGFDLIHLFHDALPELDFKDISLHTKFWWFEAASPCFISSMTAGHQGGEALNIRLAKVASERRWPMGLGSQRRELQDPKAHEEWKRLRAAAPNALFFSNLGLSQLIETPLEKVKALIENLGSAAIIIPLNPLQEVLQPEGTPSFLGGIKALEKLCKISKVPVILKETGSGFSPATLLKIRKLKLGAVDVSGLGGTHWGRIEGGRANGTIFHAASQTFDHWGESTVASLLAAKSNWRRQKKRPELWASGGIRNGLDAAKAIAIGANKVGFAKPVLEAALSGEATLHAWMDRIEFELKIALFCTGSKDIAALQKETKWQKI